MVILGIDYGPSKLGLAISDANEQYLDILDPVVYSGQEDLVKILINIFEQWHYEKIVVGIPYSPSGKVSEKGEKVKKTFENLVNRINNKLNDAELELDFYPEDFSTKHSNQGLSRKHKQKYGDSHAAKYILQKYIEWQREKE